MASFDVVNYSLRPSKTIQRQLVFDGVKRLQTHLHLEQLVYVGLGSIWFTDFVMAHKELRVHDMVSMEGDEVGFLRARFNAPFATVRVVKGMSNEVLPSLYEDPAIKGRPWMIWMDYDSELNEKITDDLRSLLENAPENSIVITTFNAYEMKYGAAPQRPDRLRDILGSVVPDDLLKNACKGDRLQETLAKLTMDFLKSVVADLARPGGFVSAFSILYKDSSPMVTVGGILPSKGSARIAKDVVAEPEWGAMPLGHIFAPNLTIREAAALQALLPSKGPLTRNEVKKLGFDLEEEQIAAFETYYRQYPSFAQIVA